MKKKLFAVALAFLSGNSFAGESAGRTAAVSSATVKLFKVAVSTDQFCAQDTMKVIYENEAGKDIDIVNPESLELGSVDAGIYNCVAVEMSKTFRLVPAAATAVGSCVAGQKVTTSNLCTGNSEVTLLDGTKTTCADDLSDTHMAMYFATGAANDGIGSHVLGRITAADTSQGLKIAALDISKDSTIVFTFGAKASLAKGQAADGDKAASCELNLDDALSLSKG